MVLTCAPFVSRGRKCRSLRVGGQMHRVPRGDLELGAGGSGVSSAVGLVNSLRLCSWVLCVLAWASHIPHTCPKPGSTPCRPRPRWVGQGSERGGAAAERHFSRLRGPDTEVRVRAAVSAVGAADGLEGPGDLGPHAQVWFLRSWYLGVLRRPITFGGSNSVGPAHCRAVSTPSLTPKHLASCNQND